MKKGQRLPLPAWRAMGARKISQSQVARKAGLGLYRYWQIENADGPDPTPDEREAVAAALGVKVSEIDWPETDRRVSA